MWFLNEAARLTHCSRNRMDHNWISGGFQAENLWKKRFRAMRSYERSRTSSHGLMNDIADKKWKNNENFAFFDNLRKWIFRLFCSRSQLFWVECHESVVCAQSRGLRCQQWVMKLNILFPISFATEEKEKATTESNRARMHFIWRADVCGNWSLHIAIIEFRVNEELLLTF